MRVIAGLLVLVVGAAAAAGCGGSTDPESAIAKASRHRDQVEGELMLAEVEVDQAFLGEDEGTAKANPRRGAKEIDEDLLRAQKTQHECREGDGLESCTEMDAIESVVEQIEAEARVGPSR